MIEVEHTFPNCKIEESAQQTSAIESKIPAVNFVKQTQLTFQVTDSKTLDLELNNIKVQYVSKKDAQRPKWVSYLFNFKPNMEVRWQKITILLFLLTTVQFIFAGYSIITVVFIKDIELDIALLTLIRSLISCFCSIILALLLEGTFSIYEYDKKTIYYFLTIGFVYAAGSPILFQIMVQLTTATFAVILQQLLPIFSFILSLILKVESPPSVHDVCFIVKIIGMFICVVSAISISALNFTVPSKEISWINWLLGTVTAIVDYLLMSLYMVLQTKIIFGSKDHPLRKKPFTLNCLTGIYGTIIYIPLCGIYMLSANVDLTLTVESSIAILYSGIILTCIGYSLLIVCVKLSTPLVTSCLFSVETVTSMILLKFFTDEDMTTPQYIISVGVIGGAILAVLSPLFDRFNKKSDPPIVHI